MHAHAHDHFAKAADPAKLSELEALAEKFEPAIAAAIRDMLRAHVEAVDLDELEKALRTGSQSRVLEIVGAVDPVKADAVKTALENAVWAGGALTARSPALSEARFVFNRLNPALIDWLESYSLNLITEINTGTRAAVRATLLTGMREGRNPIDQARTIKASVGLTERQAAAVSSYRKELETFHLKRSAKAWGLGNARSVQSGLEVMRIDAAGKPLDGIQQRRLRDQRFDGSLLRAMQTSKPLKPEQIARMVERYQERYIQHRARTIARTESLRANNAGAYEAWRQVIHGGKVDGALVRKLWLLSKDERLCPTCSAIPKANPKRGVAWDGVFLVPNHEPIKLPPQHPNCRCSPQFRLWEPSQLQES